MQAAQDAMGVEGMVFIAFLIRMLLRATQDAMAVEVLEITRTLKRLQAVATQEATDSADRGG